MSPAATMNRTTKRSHFHEGGTSVPAGERPQTPHIFNECGEGGAMVVDDPSICEFDGLCGQFFRKAETTDVEADGEFLFACRVLSCCCCLEMDGGTLTLL
jgi:hypothetical protein